METKMKWYIAKCYFNGGRIIKFRTQAYNTEGLEPTANAIAMTLTGRIPDRIEFDLCPIQR